MFWHRTEICQPVDGNPIDYYKSAMFWKFTQNLGREEEKMKVTELSYFRSTILQEIINENVIIPFLDVLNYMLKVK